MLRRLVARVGAPRRDKMTKHKYAAYAAAVTTLAACSTSASAQTPPPPRAGVYECVIMSLSVQAMNEFRTNLVTGTRGLELAMRPGLQVTRAPFDLILDGRGGYTARGAVGRGRYSYNTQSGRISFDGDISMLTARQYFVTKGVSALVFESRTGAIWQCEHHVASGNDARPAAQSGATNTGPSGGVETPERSRNGGLRGTLITTPSEAMDGFIGRLILTELTAGTQRTLFDNGLAAANASGTIFHVDTRAQMQVADRSGNRVALVQEAGRLGIRDLQPAISPDGQRIALTTGRKEGIVTTGDQVIVIDRAGKLLATFEGFGDPAFLPDGGLIVAGAALNGERRNEGLHVIDRGLRTPRRLGSGNETARWPAVSPDGSRIAFVRNGEVWTMAASGADAKPMITGSDARYPAWSPDGRYLAASTIDPTTRRRLVYISEAKDDGKGFWVRGADGANIISNNRVVWLP
jgi:hypothetical protein